MGFKSHFASEMQRVREEVGLSRKQLAEAIGTYKEPSIRAVENGHRTPTIALAIGLDKVFGTHGMFVAMQPEAETDGSPFGELKESEQRATSIRIWDMRVMPGLLQTEEYAFAVLGDRDAVGRRMQRQEIFSRETPPDVRVVIDEGLLYKEVGGPVVLRRQLEWLIRPDAPWTLQVLPDMAGAHNGMSGPLTLLEFADEAPIAFVDSRTGGTVVDDPDQVAAQWKDWERLVGDALPPDVSREMIREVIANLPED